MTLPVRITVRYGFLKLRAAHFDVYDRSGRVVINGKLTQGLHAEFEGQIRQLFISPLLRQSGTIPVTILYNPYTGRYAFVLGMTPNEYAEREEYIDLLFQSGLNIIDLRHVTGDPNGLVTTITGMEQGLREHLLRIGRHAQTTLDEAQLARLAYAAGVPITASKEDRLIGIALALGTLLSREKWIELGGKLFLNKLTSDPTLQEAWQRFMNDYASGDLNDPEAIASAYIKAGFIHAPCCDGKNPYCPVEQAMLRQRAK